MNNYYNSISLSKYLFYLKIHTNGTFRKRRGIDTRFFNEIPEKYGFNYELVDEKFSIFHFNDNKSVIFGTTAYGNKYENIGKKVWEYDRANQRKIPKIVQKKIPLAIRKYNKNMNGVDRFNKSVKSFGLRRTSKKWDRKLSVFLLESILHNSFLLLKKPGASYSKTDFLKVCRNRF